MLPSMSLTSRLLRRAAPLSAAQRLRCYTASSSADASSVLTPMVSVRNSAAPLGRLALQLPLPGRPGLSPVEINDEMSTVQTLIDTVTKADASLKAVEITTTNGTKVARTTQLRELTGMDFILRLNNVSISIENDGAKEVTRQRGEALAFATVKTTIEKDSRPYVRDPLRLAVSAQIPLAEFYKICLNAGAEEAVANKWLRELQRRNLAVHFDRSTNEELRSAVILRPDSTESQLMLQNALDSELYNLRHTRRSLESKLTELESDLKKALAVDADIRKAATKLPNTGKWLALTGISSFYAWWMYLVWDVYSWDVMEPISYFVGFTSILGASFYHSVTKNDATYTNIWQKNYQLRLAKLNEERRFNPAKIDELRLKITDVQRDVELLMRLEGQSPQ
ncbi:hypothetical protein P43SY_004558 [Pythium insidiosum]|uniref:Calcium uniporter protein C-terminal domain-containing protein n=1 Tax=Pythium insidiosum TaxID=114742 RepID=A0AAD5M9B2_PYTIN|nr:hypothetical protein P43SY_004558 [Pythium insidiosum]